VIQEVRYIRRPNQHCSSTRMLALQHLSSFFITASSARIVSPHACAMYIRAHGVVFSSLPWPLGCLSVATTPLRMCLRGSSTRSSWTTRPAFISRPKDAMGRCIDNGKRIKRSSDLFYRQSARHNLPGRNIPSHHTIYGVTFFSLTSLLCN
jgi:hypothetical protein